MGLTGYLVQRRDLAERGKENDKVLYETKVFVPFAWNLLFRATDLKKLGAELSLATKASDAVALAHKRMKGLKPIVTPRLRKVLDQFVASIDTTAPGFLVLDPHRLDISEAELLAPLKWFDAPDEKTAEQVFGNDDGVELDELLDVGDRERVAGWTVDGKTPPWLEGEDEDEDEEEKDSDEEDA